ncbi:sulfur oxidation protein SoxZ [bacterium BMS3Bbin10]|nr:sulfur oxidation protein SoxZ [bacterium BMS3Bbin10]
MAIKPRVKVPKSAKVGDTIQIKTLISHKMETGLRKDKKTGKKIPRQIINMFVAKFNGKQVFQAKMYPSISANPYIAFFLKVPEAGELDFTWTDDSGKTWSAKKKLAVS